MASTASEAQPEPSQRTVDESLNTTGVSHGTSANDDRLRSELRRALLDKDCEEVLGVMCDGNGWSLQELPQTAFTVTEMELFLLNMPRLPEVRFFPHLTTVKLIHVGLERMSDLRSLVHVEELWLSDNAITAIEGLEGMTRLRRLYLQGNALTSMSGLPVLKHLRELWLCHNAITSISALGNVRKLRLLWLAENPIDHISADVFGSFLSHLHDVNLAGCRLHSFSDVAQLAVLPCLRHVRFADPLFGDNPVCRCNNYPTFTLHLLPTLESLDSTVVTAEQHAVAGSIYDKKHAYYGVRIHTLERNAWALRTHLDSVVLSRKLDSSRAAQEELHKKLAPVQVELAERAAYQRGRLFPPSVSTAQLEAVRDTLLRAVTTREVERQRWVRQQAEAVETSSLLQKRLSEQLCVELNTGGNVRLDEASSKDSWYASAQELLLSRFDVAQYASFGITGVTVHRVHRVVNRGLRLRFDERVKELGIDLSDADSRKGLVCLFAEVPATLEEQEAVLQRVLLRGMDSADGDPRATASGGALSSYIPSDDGEGVVLTNSVFCADEERLRQCQRRGELDGVNANVNALGGKLLVVRVFLGKSVSAIGGNGGAAGSLKQDREETSSSSASAPRSFLRGARRRVLRKDYGPDVASVYRTLHVPGGGSEHSTRVRVWHCFDRALVLPEFVVDYTYTLKTALQTTKPDVALLSAPQEKLRGEVEAILAHTSTTTATSLGGSPANSLKTRAMPSTDWSDVRAACYPLMALIRRCADAGPLDEVAQRETEAALEAATAVLSNVRRHSASAPGAATSTGGPLKAAAFTQYREALAVPDDTLTYCSLRATGVTAIPIDFDGAPLNCLTSLDLSANALRTVSWMALAGAAPALQHLDLSGNQLSRLDLRGSTLAHLISLNLRRNILCHVEEFGDVVVSFPHLEELFVEGNPLMRQKNVEARLVGLLVMGPLRGEQHTASPMTRLNDIDLTSMHRPSTTRTRLDRTLDLRLSEGEAQQASGKDNGTSTTVGASAAATALQYVVNTTYARVGRGQSCYDPTVLDVNVVPARLFDHAVRVAQAAADPVQRQQLVAQVARERVNGGASGGSGAASATHYPLSEVATFQYEFSTLQQLRWVCLLPNLRHLALRGHCLTEVGPIARYLPQLESLDLQDNCIASLPGELAEMQQLRVLDVSFNELTSSTCGPTTTSLRQLALSGNRLTSLDALQLLRCAELEQLYVAHNQLTSVKELYPLKALPNLLTLDVVGNPFNAASTSSNHHKHHTGVRHDSVGSADANASGSSSRFYFVYHFRKLKVLDGVPVTSAEVNQAREVFGGKVSHDLLTERLSTVGSTNWHTVTELDLSHCGLREVSQLEGLHALEVLRLQHNALVTVDGVRVLLKLKALNVAHNRIGTSTTPSAVGAALKPLTQLESLSLEGNHLVDLTALELVSPSLKFLNLKGNELQYLDKGLQHLPQLRELLLDQNKLRTLSVDCFAGCRQLVELTADENALRSTDGLVRLSRLQHIRLGANRLGELAPLLRDLANCSLLTATFVGNAITRKSLYRSTVIAQFPSLTCLDGRDISPDEREKAELVRHAESAPPPNVVIDLSYFAPPSSRVEGAAGARTPSPVSAAAGQGSAAYTSRVVMRNGSGGTAAAAAVLPSSQGRLQPLANSIAVKNYVNGRKISGAAAAARGGAGGVPSAAHRGSRN